MNKIENINKITFEFNLGNSPTTIEGNVSTIKIGGKEDNKSDKMKITSVGKNVEIL